MVEVVAVVEVAVSVVAVLVVSVRLVLERVVVVTVMDVIEVAEVVVSRHESYPGGQLPSSTSMKSTQTPRVVLHLPCVPVP